MTLYKESDDPTVLSFDQPRGLMARFRRGIKRRLLELGGKEISSRPAGAVFFTDDRSQHGAEVLCQLPPTDILNLHWIVGFFDFRGFFRKLPHGLPVVWTLHDMNPFTGGCHHAADCQKFHAECGACPQLESRVENDLSRQIWNRKREGYGFLQKRAITFVTPSRWLAGKFKESSLTAGFTVNVFPYGVDTEIFRPQQVQMARNALGIPQDAVVVVFASYLARDSYKGFPLLLEALNKMRTTPNLLAVTVGDGEPYSYRDSAVPIKSLGFIKCEKQMSKVYNSANLFVLPSLQDNFPNTALEALACGVPTVAFQVGGVPEIVRNGQTGLTVESGDARSLATAIEKLLGDDQKRAEMSAECRRVAVAEYALEVQAKRYVGLYEEMLSEK